ncbi:unnamed protein product [Alopecurus aequalis]
MDVTTLAATFSCPVQSFPCTYLGLPLSDQRLRKSDLQPYLDKLAGKVKGWNKGSFSLDARLLLVKHVISAMHIHQLLVIDPPAWLIKAIDKLRRGFLWCNRELSTGGKCLVRWTSICRPPVFGGLGIVDLHRKATALRVRWLWQSWTQTDKAWGDLPLGIDDRARNLFNAAVSFNLGDGNKISFWKDPWLNGQSFATLAPELFQCCTLRGLTVAQAVIDNKWMKHYKRNITPAALRQFLLIHDIVQDVQLRQDVPDSVTWRWTANGQYSAASAYDMQFEGSIRFSFKDTIWSSGAPLKCRIFGWLAILGKCHTADCLQRKGWPHNAACVFCLSEHETALHLLATCPVISRLWIKLFHTAGLNNNLLPTQDDDSLDSWLTRTRRQLPPTLKKNWCALVHLTWWTIWKERNSRIFNNAAESLSRLHANIVAEAKCWRDAGRTGAADLLLRPREPD